MSSLRKVLTYLTVAAAALLGAVNYELFVFPNQFAPSGLNGICTMVQHLTGFSVGYLSLIINVPLALLVWRFMTYYVCLLAGCADAVYTGLRKKRKPIERDERINT